MLTISNTVSSFNRAVFCSLQWCVSSQWSSSNHDSNQFAIYLYMLSVHIFLWQTISRPLGVPSDSHLKFDKHISNVCSSSCFHIHTLRHISLIRKFVRPLLIRLFVPDKIMPILFLLVFLLAKSIIFSAFKISWHESILIQQQTPPQLSIYFIGFQFGNDSI